MPVTQFSVSTLQSGAASPLATVLKGLEGENVHFTLEGKVVTVRP